MTDNRVVWVFRQWNRCLEFGIHIQTSLRNLFWDTVLEIDGDCTARMLTCQNTHFRGLLFVTSSWKKGREQYWVQISLWWVHQAETSECFQTPKSSNRIRLLVFYSGFQLLHPWHLTKQNSSSFIYYLMYMIFIHIFS